MLLQGHQPLRLNVPDSIWIVESGQVELFAVQLQGSEPAGKRRYLFTLQSGEALFGMPPPEQTSSLAYELLAVAFGQAVLRQWSPGPQLTQTELTQVVMLIQHWLEHWVAAGIAVEPVEFLSTPTAWPQLQAQLRQQHLRLFQAIAQYDRADAARKQAQFSASQQFNQGTQTTAIRHLTTLISPQPEPLNKQDPLLRVMEVIGERLGIAITPPTASETSNSRYTPIAAIARSSHIRFRRIILREGWWHSDCGPLLAYTRETNQPVALLPNQTGRYFQLDPTTGECTPLTTKTTQQLQSSAYMFYRALPERPLKGSDLLRFAFKGRRRDLWILVWTGAGAALLTMVTPLAIGILIDQAIPDADRGLLFQMGIGLLAASLGNALFLLAQGFAIVRLQSFSDATAQTALWDRLLNLHLAFFRQYTTGDLQVRVSAINQIRERLNSQVLRLLFTSFFAVLNLGLLLVYSPLLAMGAFVMALVTTGLTAIASLFSCRQLRVLLQFKGEIFGLVVQLIDGVAKLRLAGAEYRALAQWATVYTKQQQLVLNTQLIADLIQAWNTVLPTISRMIIFAMVITVVFYDQAGGRLSTGSFLAFNTALAIFLTGVSALSVTLTENLEILVLWERVQPLLASEPERDLRKADPGQLTGQLRLYQVSFRYSTHAPLTLNRVTLEAQPGEFIAIVGPSGSGKSTIVRLLLGFETPSSGSVLYNDRDLADLDVTAVRQQLGVVLQHSRLLSASIFENIACGALLTMEEAWEACQKAGLAEDIEALPMGMHTIVSEGGTNFSGGQRQRLLIARALALKPRILIFDEATSALDNHTQAIVSRSIEQLNVTRIVIAHRLSTIRSANRIYVIQQGQIIQQGSFDDLSQQEGLFAKLIGRQIA